MSPHPCKDVDKGGGGGGGGGLVGGLKPPQFFCIH